MHSINMKKSLLELAKEIKIKPNRLRNSSKEEVELVLAHLNGEITIRQAAKALNVENPGNVSQLIPAILRYGLVNNLIDIVWKK